MLLVGTGFGLAALVASGILLTLGLETFVQEAAELPGFESDNVLGEGLDWYNAISAQLAFIGALASALTVVPAVLTIIVGEVGGIRSAVYYVIAGGAALACIPLLTTLLADEAVALPSTKIFQLLATAGFGGGLVYWLIAGRGAR